MSDKYQSKPSRLSSCFRISSTYPFCFCSFICSFVFFFFLKTVLRCLFSVRILIFAAWCFTEGRCGNVEEQQKPVGCNDRFFCLIRKTKTKKLSLGDTRREDRKTWKCCWFILIVISFPIYHILCSVVFPSFFNKIKEEEGNLTNEKESLIRTVSKIIQSFFFFLFRLSSAD